MKRKLLIFLAVTFMLSGCTVQRRHHMKGWDIQWHKKTNKRIVSSSDTLPNTEFDIAVNDINNQSTFQHKSKRSEELLNSEQNTPIPNKFSSSKEEVNFEIKNEVQNNAYSAVRHIETISHSNLANVKNDKSGNTLLLSISMLLALSVMGGLRLGKKKLRKLTRWAKANPKSTIGLIAGVQIPLAVMSLYGGYDLYKLGYSISEGPLYLAAGIVTAGMVSIPFFLKRDEFVLPSVLKRRRLAFLGISIASLMLIAGAGNNAHKDYPNSLITQSLERVDNLIFPNQNYEETTIHFGKSDTLKIVLNNGDTYVGVKTGEDENGYNIRQNDGRIVYLEKSDIKEARLLNSQTTTNIKEEKDVTDEATTEEVSYVRNRVDNNTHNQRTAVGGGIIFLAILGILFLIGTLCAGICLVILSSGNPGMILVGIIIAVLSILGIKGIFEWARANS